MARHDPAPLRRLDVEPINIRPPFEVRRTLIYDLEASRLDFLAAVHEPLTGIELGSYDERMLRWLAGWDTPTVGTLVSLLHRARSSPPAVACREGKPSTSAPSRSAVKPALTGRKPARWWTTTRSPRSAAASSPLLAAAWPPGTSTPYPSWPRCQCRHRARCRCGRAPGRRL